MSPPQIPTIGRIVFYKLADKGAVRPAIITHVWSEDSRQRVNLTVFYDVQDPIEPGEEPGRPRARVSIPFHGSASRGGTWHWPVIKR